MNREISELKVKDRDWIDQNATRGATLCHSYGITQKELLTPAALDQVFKSWKKDRRSDKPTGAEIIHGLGCLFGQLMCQEFGLQWKIVTDNFGTDLALVHSKSTWETYPLHFVAKRVQPDSDGLYFFAAMEKLMHDKLFRGS